jgi:hypothetical protein
MPLKGATCDLIRSRVRNDREEEVADGIYAGRAVDSR